MRRIVLLFAGCLGLLFTQPTWAQPANDAFASAWTLTGAVVSTNGNSNGGTKETGEPNHAGRPGGRSVWFNWTAPRSATVRISTDGSAFNTLLGVYTGNSVSALALVAENDDIQPGFGGNNRSRVEFLANAGTTYRVAIDGRSGGGGGGAASGAYVLSIQTLASVVFAAPTNNSVQFAGTPIPLRVDVTVPTPPVQRVDFYWFESIIGSDTSAPYESVFSGAILGTNAFRAVALDGAGLSWTSSVVNVVVLSEGVTIVSPLNPSYLFSTNPLPVSAVGLLPPGAGTITNVEFFVDGQRFAQDGSAPFSAVWSTVTPGTHRLTATGRSSLGATYNSAPANVAVARTLVPSNSVWKYLDNGTDQGAAWVASDFNDSSWASGPAQLGYGDGDEATVVGFGPDPNNRYITTYFRRSFPVENAAQYLGMLLNVQKDDGAVAYLNGVEVARYNMPGGPVNFTTLAPNDPADGAGFNSAFVDGSLLVEGNNVLAVEVHQTTASSSDISFNLELVAIPNIILNSEPLLEIVTPPDGFTFYGPASIDFEADAFDEDGTIARLEFFVDGTKLGESPSAPASVVWTAPPLGPHTLTAVATDDQGAKTTRSVSIFVYDAAGTPLVNLLSPSSGSTFEAPTNLLLIASAYAPAGITNVQFLNRGAVIGSARQTPYTNLWVNAAVGTNLLAAVGYDGTGRAVTSQVATVIVRPPPPNVLAPTIASVSPVPETTVASLTSIQVTFSERVTGVDATDLLINGVPAAGVTGSGTTYTFTFPRPANGIVLVTWSNLANIYDVGFPPLGFDGGEPGAFWSYEQVDAEPPTVFARTPAAGATVTNLTQITVVFSEPVRGVDAADLLVNGTPAFGVSGSGSNYTFSLNQPAGGAVNVGWATTAGISDLANPSNPFNPTGAGATWAYTLDLRTILVQSNATWRFLKGVAEASSPIDAWRGLAYDDAGWSNAAAPFYYGDPYSTAANPGTLLSDMQAGYSSIYLRHKFTVPFAAAVSNLFLVHQSDDGFIAWINGAEVIRYNLGAGEIPYNGSAPSSINEPNNSGAPYTSVTLANPAAYLVNGENVLTVHAFNNQPTTSSDFGFNAQLYTFVLDPSTVPPTVVNVSPRAGEIFALTNITVTFSEAVTGVTAGDLLVNGVPATTVTSTTNTTYTFGFAQPAFGRVDLSWATDHGIQDSDVPPKAFDRTGAGATLSYTLINPSAPTVASQSPSANSVVSQLTQVTVNFSEAVQGVNAADLLINGVPAAGISGGPANYVFTFPQPAYGPINLAWAAGAGITDRENPANPFDPARAVNLWSYTLVDQTAPVIAAQSPASGSSVVNLTSLTVTFSEPVTGVNAGDLLINGEPATSVSGGPTTWTFAFPQPNATVINISWLNAHGIRDLAPVSNPFDASGPGAAWSYTTVDNLAPQVAVLTPPPGATVRSLAQLVVSFTEPVAGLGTNDLLMNNRPALSLSGSGAGPYTFNFTAPSNGLVELRWIVGHGITDLASPPNAFSGGDWTYTLDPNASFAGSVVISEIMFNPPGGAPADEWIELLNVSPSPVNLTGWRFNRGVDFTFPSVSLPLGARLVVAANTNAFRAHFPAVNNVIGGWNGRLANSEETIRLVTALGEPVNEVHYATAGDWAVRERGHGADRVEGISLAGTTATITIFSHGFTGNDRVMISGADQPEFNGIFTIANVGASTFTINVPGATGTPTGNLLCRQIIDDGTSGWSWFSGADGLGFSLELINPGRPNSLGQNWRASAVVNGTPGLANSVHSTNTAPFITEVRHTPAVPRSTDAVAVTARVSDERLNGVSGVSLYYRDHTTTGPGAFLQVPMLDNGTSGDGLANDGLYGVVLPAQANGTVTEFYVQATDLTAQSRTWPAAAWETNQTTGQFANAYFQVDDESISNAMPAIRVIMSGTERAIYGAINQNSDAEQNVTAILTDGDSTEIRHLGGVRIRGAGSRSRTPKNNRLNLPNDQPWRGMVALNLNSQFVHSQLMGAAVARKSGLPAADAYVIQYRMNGVNPAPQTTPGGNNGAGYGTFILVQPVNGDLAADLFPEDGDGNVYRASTGNHNADLSFQGTPNGYLNRGYFKTSNQTENDWTDLINLTAAFSQLNDADFAEAVKTNLNVTLWMRYFAVGSLVNFGETALFNGRGDDYAMYRGVKDPRFVLIGHDFDTIFGQGDTTSGYAIDTNSSPFIMMNPPNTAGQSPNVPLLRRLMTNDHYVPVFFSELLRLSETVFQPAQLNPLFDQLLSGWGPSTTTIDAMKTHAANRRARVLAQIPLHLTIGHGLTTTSNGLAYTTSPALTLFGDSHAVNTRKVLVNGSSATRVAWQARWTNTVSLHPGVNRVLVQSIDANDVEFERATVDVWYDDSTITSVAGAIAADTVWTAANGPYQVTANLTVNSGVTLTIQPGTTVWLGSGVNLTVANGGRLNAEGTDTARIRFAAVPGAGNWGGIVINGSANSPESRIAFAHLDGNNSTAIDVADGTAFLSHLTFGNTGRQYLALDRASFIVEDCVFPAITGSFEPTHGTGGIKAGGRGIFRRNYFGRVQGYNDALDFTGGNRPGPILQVLNNVFMGSDDDLLDLDSTDAWVEGNIFLHTHRKGTPDSASAVSGGADNADTSQITIVRNLFFDVDQAANAKQGNFYTMVNNTVVRQTNVGSDDTNTAVVILADINEQGVATAQGEGFYLEGNIIVGAQNLTRNVTTALVTYSNNLIHQLTGPAWSGSGSGNVYADPLLKRIPDLTETAAYASWAEAQILWDHFSPQAGSPALGRGPNGRDLGGRVRYGVSIAGEPAGRTASTSAALTVGYNQTGYGVPVAGFPNGSGHTHYRWRLDGGAWSSEVPIATPITLNNLGTGPHFVEVTGRNDAGFYQDDSAFGVDASLTTSRTWIVDPTASPLRLNEVLAANSGAVVNGGTTPDAVELFNASRQPISLAGLRLTDDAGEPDKFTFPAGASIPAGGYLVVYADNASAAPGYHLGFNLNQNGDALYLFAAVEDGGALLDSVVFGMQLANLSVGRLAGGDWALTVPTFGAANQAARVDNPQAIRINEWLASGTSPFDQDFVELYNPGSLPVAIGGLYFSDELVGQPDRHRVPALTFIAAFGYQRFLADGNASSGADHLNFNLGSAQGEIGLFRSDLTVIDCVYYQPQRLNVSQGRSPNGSGVIAFFDTPTPGAPNPLISANPLGGALVVNEVLANNASLVEAGRTPDWIELYNGTTNTVTLDDLSLTDDTLQPRRFIFPSPTTLAPAARLRVLCDPGTPNTGPLVNPNFALKSTGGGVYLFDALSRGGSLLSSVVYGLQTPDLSIGRVPDGGANWVLNLPSPNSPNLAVPTLGAATSLRVNEWLADPLPGNDDWFELYNSGPLPVALGGLFLTDDLNNRTKHPIAPLSFLGNGTNAFQRFTADGNTGAGADHVNFSLRGAGEALGISTSASLLDGLVFGAQSQGVSEGRFPDGASDIVRFPGTASPGESNWRWLTNVVINEVLTHTDLPLEDAIELRNVTTTAVDVGGWWLSDDNGTLRKYQIPAPRVIPPGGYTVIYETAFTNIVTAAVPFALSSTGDEVVLSASSAGQLTGFRTRVSFGAQFNGVSFGRHVTSDNREEFVALTSRTLGVDDPGSVEEFRTGTGAANTYPRIGPVVISEVMYHPPDQGTNDNVLDEFVELRNITTAPVALFDAAHPTNTWHLRDAVDFDFASGTTIPAGGYLLVVSFNPINNPATLAAFRARYSVSASTPIVGPWSGRLANDTDDIELRRPDEPNLDGAVPYILVERVRYQDTAPWPADADGTGRSLQRVDNTLFGNDPANWAAASPTPGPQASGLDTDRDGLPDFWESTYGFDPLNPADAALDADGDGLSNLEEFRLGTNPRDRNSGLAITRIELRPDGQVTLTFTAAANAGYRIDYTDNLASPWINVDSVDAAPTSRVIQLTYPPEGAQGFFRLQLQR